MEKCQRCKKESNILLGDYGELFCQKCYKEVTELEKLFQLIEEFEKMLNKLKMDSRPEIQLYMVSKDFTDGYNNALNDIEKHLELLKERL